MLDGAEELVFGGPLHLCIQFLHAGKLGIGCPVMEVAIDMLMEVDGDGELGFQSANCSD
jgi:hypothetical protein